MRHLLLYSLVIAVFLAGIVATPFILEAAAPGGLNWARLSDVAQVYGAVSVVISTLALIGVVTSLILQARQTQAALEDASWNSHRELIFKAIDHPHLAACWEPPTCATTVQEWSQIAYVNLIVTHWDKAFRLGRITPEQMRMVARKHFTGELARRHWGASGGDWIRLAQHSRSRRTRQFPIIMDGEYRAACQAGPATSPAHYFGAVSP
ncbi:hypothetical protein RKD49_007072 [Streptomyces glaucescens]